MAIVQEAVERQERLVVLPKKEELLEYDVFLSYNGKDRDEVKRLAEDLRAEGVLPWLDVERILPGDQFVAELQKALDQTAVGLALIGQGRWQEQELFVMLQRVAEHRETHGKEPLTLIPALLPGAPDEPDMPPFLRGFNRIDFRSGGFDDGGEMRRLVKRVLSPRDRF